MKKSITILLSIILSGCLLLIQQEAIKEYLNLSSYQYLSENINIELLKKDKVIFLGTFSQPNFETVSSSFNTLLTDKLNLKFPSIFANMTPKNNMNIEVNYNELKYSIISNSIDQKKYLKKLATDINQRFICYTYFKYYGIISTENMTIYTGSLGNLPYTYDNRAIIISFRIWDCLEEKLIIDKEINFISADFDQDSYLYFNSAIDDILNSIYMLKYDRKTQLIFNSICNEYHIVSLSDVEYFFNKIGGRTKRNNIDCIFYLDNKAQYCPLDKEQLDSYYKSKVRQLILNSKFMENR